jgi:5S rRNA maturation endonuclease (ribonuclease M5)
MPIIMNRIKKSHSYDQAKLKYVSDALCDNIEELLDTLGIEGYKNLGKLIAMSCPVHGGDNESALNIYHQGDSYRGNWKCRTHQCEETFKGSIIGFIRGCLSHNTYGWVKSGDNICSFKEALDFATAFIREDFSNIKISRKAKEKTAFVNTVKYISDNNQDNSPKISKDVIRKSLSIPSDYFLNRGFSSLTLNNYDVGDCLAQGKEMHGRAVVPIYDQDFKYMVGCTGRSIYEKCSQCKSYHDPKTNCPTPDSLWKYSKWKHNTGFKTQEHLYNFWIAQHRIKETSCVILVESPGNVWRLSEAGIINAVAVFGSSLSDRQKMILDTSGAMTIITIMDNDEAGQKAAIQIKHKCEKTYNIKNISPSKEDIASMSIEEINNEIKPLIKDFI